MKHWIDCIGRSQLRLVAFCLMFLSGLGAAYIASTMAHSIALQQTAHRTVRLPDFVALAKRFAPSLVHISTVYRRIGEAPANPGEEDPAAPYSDAPGGLGSGIVINREGHIVTNYHVVEHTDKVVVKLADRRELDATIVGRDARSDIALLKVTPPTALKPAPVGDSSRLETGEWVIAMGSPFGLDRTVTAGIVSAKARRIAASVYYDYIQTDVSINPGNSGGPLLNLRGQVVGINTAMLSRNGANVGINFAIPINLVKDLLPDLLAKGRVTRGWLGISTQIMSPAVARRLKIDPTLGALVVAVDPNGPAAQAGIQPGDVVVDYDGKPVIDAGDLPALVAKTVIGRQVELRISRNRILYQVMLPVGQLKEPELVTAQAGAAPPSFATQPRIDERKAVQVKPNFSIIEASAGRGFSPPAPVHGILPL